MSITLKHHISSKEYNEMWQTDFPLLRVYMFSFFHITYLSDSDQGDTHSCFMCMMSMYHDNGMF